MNNFKKFTVFVLLVTSLFMTGCDAKQIMDVISGIAKGVTEAMPKIKEVIDTIKGALPNNDNNATATPTAAVASNTAVIATPTAVIASPAAVIDNNTGNDAEIKVTPANDDEEVTAPAAEG